MQAARRKQREHAAVLQQSGAVRERADFEAGEKSGERKIRKLPANIGGIVVRDSVQAGAARDAIEVKSERGRRAGDGLSEAFEFGFKFYARALAVAQGETD